MDNDDKEFEILPESEEEIESGSNFEEPDYGNYDYSDNQTTDIVDSGEVGDIPTTEATPQSIDTGGQPANIAEPHQNPAKAGNNVSDKLADKNGGRDAFAKTLDNKNYYDDALKKNREEQKKLQKNYADAKKDNADKKNALDQKKKTTEEKRKGLTDAKNKAKGESGDNKGVAERIRANKGRRTALAPQRQEFKDAKKDEKGAAKDQKDSEKKLDDSKNALEKNRDERKKLLKDKDKAEKFKQKHPVQAAKMMAKNAIKKIKKVIVVKLLLPFLIILVAFAFLVDLIYEVFEAVDTAITYVANVQEKMDNFVNGLGFQNSEDAFYAELEELQKEYNNSIDVPLLLSTLFYDDIQNNMDPSEVNADVVEDDESMVSFAAAFDYVINYIKGKYEESNITVGKDGYKYSSNKIYRMRMLAKNMVKKDGSRTAHVTFTRYLKIYGARIGESLLKIFNWRNIVGLLIKALTLGMVDVFNIVEDIFSLLTGSEVFETTDFYNYIKDKSPIAGIIALIKAIFSPFSEIEDISLCAGATYSESNKQLKYVDENGNEVTVSEDQLNDESTTYDSGIICIDYALYSGTSDEYFDYLKSYYIPRMPEFKKYITAEDEETREQQIDQIINGIKEIYEDYKYYFEIEDENAEEYTNGCVGSISTDLVPKLSLPVTTANVTSISGRDAYGIINGRQNNGVYLTHTNSGINEGDNVVSIADGKVVGIGRTNGEQQGDISITTTGVSKTYTLTDQEYKNLASQCLAEQGTAEGIRYEISQMLNLYEKRVRTGKTTEKNVHDYVKNGGWYSCSAQHMNPSCTNGCLCEKKNKTIVYKYTDEAVAIVKDVIENGNRTFPSYVTEHDCWNCNSKNTCSDGKKGDICKLEVNGKLLTSMSDIMNKDNYIKDVTKVYTTSTKDGYWIFDSFANDKSDPFGYYTSDKAAVENDEFKVQEASSNQITIEHENTGAYKIYSVYKYLGSIPDDLTIGSSVLKGQTIGTVGIAAGYSEASFYFEVRDRNKQAMNPTNLFIPCYSKDTLVGSNNKEKIWFYLLANGFTKEGAAGVLGNIAHEASPPFEPVSLEGTSKKKSGYTSEQFTQEVDNGTISRDEFMCSTRFGLQNSDGSYVGNEDSSKICAKLGLAGGEYGYGLNGFTYPTVKEYLLKHTLDVGVSIGDLKGQMDSFLDYLGNNNQSLLNYLKTASSAGDAAEKMMVEYERPRSLTQGEEKRRTAISNRRNEAEKIYLEYKDMAIPSANTGGGQASSAGFIWPCDSRNITSYFGNRTAPTAGATTDHRGIDIGMAEGNNIYTVADGVVSQVNESSARGKYIRVKHDSGYQTLYQHLSSINVSTGQRVTQGQVIGLSGNTGITKGPHLHFEVFNIGVEPDGYSKNSMDPMLVLPSIQ